MIKPGKPGSAPPAWFDLVYWTVRRRLRDSEQEAEEVVLGVFRELASHSRRAHAEMAIEGWLYRHAAAAARAASSMTPGASVPGAFSPDSREPRRSPGWNDLEPALDDAMSELDPHDQDLLVRRYFLKRSQHELSTVLGIEEVQLEVRLNHALGALVKALSGRGVRLEPSVLAALISTHAVVPGPAALGVRAMALLQDRGGVTRANRNPWWAVAAVMGLMAVSLWMGARWQHLRVVELQRQLASTRERLARSLARSGDSDRLADLARVELELRQSQAAELTRLRRRLGALVEAEQENAALRDELTAMEREVDRMAGATTAATNSAAEGSSLTDSSEEVQGMVARMVYLRGWGVALLGYAANHGGQLPASLSAAAGYWGDGSDLRGAASQAGVSEDQYELVYRGSLTDLTAPERTIVLMEREPVATSAGTWVKTYLFADGHSEIRAAADGDFSSWERDRVVPSPAVGEDGAGEE